MRTLLHGLGLTVLILALTACGGSGGGGDDNDDDNAGGGGGGGGDDQTLVETFYPSGDPESSGYVDADGERTGTWTVWFDGGGEWFRGDFQDDALDDTATWIEHNANGSVRYHQTDGAYPGTPPMPALP